MLMLELIAVTFAIIVLIVVLVMCTCIICNIDIAEWIGNFKTRNDYSNDSNEPLYSYQVEKYKQRKKKGIKHCRLCGATIDLINDTTYCDAFDTNYLYPDTKTKLCINCQYTVHKNGLITVPYSKDIGEYFDNKWGSYGRKIRNREQRERYANLIIKMNMITDWNFIKHWYKSYFNRNKSFKLDDGSLEIIHEKDVESLLDDKTYDKLVDILSIAGDNPLFKLIKYDDVINYLTQYFSNEPKCYKCETKIFTPRMSQIMRNKIEQDDSLDDITKYSKLYHFEQKVKDKIGNVNYFIDKNTGKIKPYCNECVQKSIGKDKEHSTVIPLEPIIYYNNLDEIKEML